MAELSALGHAGSDSYVGLETIPSPGLRVLTFQSDELTAVCPVTGQPDMYGCQIEVTDPPATIESKSLKIYLSKYRDQGMFAESLAVQIKKDVTEALQMHDPGVLFHEDQVVVELIQKRRGGIEIRVIA